MSATTVRLIMVHQISLLGRLSYHISRNKELYYFKQDVSVILICRNLVLIIIILQVFHWQRELRIFSTKLYEHTKSDIRVKVSYHQSCMQRGSYRATVGWPVVGMTTKERRGPLTIFAVENKKFGFMFGWAADKSSRWANYVSNLW